MNQLHKYQACLSRDGNSGWDEMQLQIPETYGLGRLFKLLLAFFVFAVIFPESGNAAAAIEKVAPTIEWAPATGGGGCAGQPHATLSAAVACILQTNSFCGEWDTTPVQLTPDGYGLGRTVYETCQPPSNRSGPIYLTPQQLGVIISAVGSCSTPYTGDPSQFYNAPGYQFATPDFYQTHGYCFIRVVENDQSRKPPDLCVNNPITPGTGNKRQVDIDYAGAGSFPLTLSRTYNSGVQYGQFWKTNYDLSISYGDASTATATLNRPEGAYTFTRSGTTWIPDGDVNYSLSGNDGYFTVTSPDGGVRESYNGNNKLEYLQNAANGTKYTLTYSESWTPPSIAPAAGLLIKVADAFGHTLNFMYDSTSRLATMLDPNGGLYQYAYDSAGNLTSVTYPDSKVKQYVYNESTYTSGVNRPNLLTGIVDENSARFANFGYSSTGLAVLSEHSGGAARHEVAYATPPTLNVSVTIDAVNRIKYVYRSYSAPSGVTVTDALGTARTYGFSTSYGNVKTTGSDKAGTSFCSAIPQSRTLDANGNPDVVTDFNGNVTTYDFDLARNLETSRTEAYGTPRARTITTSWNPTFRLPALITELNRTTGYTYDTSGNVLTKTITDTSVTPNVARTWSYTYNSYGQALTEDGPRTDASDITTYTYYNCSTGYQCGQLQTVTNALGQITTYNTYNTHGQPLTITDPNGIVTTLTYDTRARLTSRAVGSETTTFEYWPTGLLKKVTLPDNSYLLYTYDNAHRLYKIEDGSSNRIQYTLDAMGNRTAENVYDPSSVLTRTHTRVINSLNQLWKDIGAAGTAAVTTAFTYDSNGNQTNINAPLSRNTVNAYDELNRLKQITDPASGVTQFGYDANDNLTSVADPRSLATNYTYTGFGDLKTQVSPDTGTTTNTYDSGGNLNTSTDARSAITTYTYDALNRVATAAFKIGATTDQTITYTYDAGTNGKGHLTGASDANHSLAWTYDALGRVTGKGQTIGAVTKSVGYGYTSGRLATITMPSGQIVTYGYNSNNQVTSVTVGATTVLSAVTYQPFGPVTGWTWGNATTMARSFDTDGKLSQFNSGGLKTYAYDDAFRITGITDTVTAANSYTYGYNSLDRITSASKTGTTYGWTYDANGNRLTQTGSGAATYTVSGANNRISSITGGLARTYSYDAAGNTLGYTTATAAYNNRGRMKTLVKASVTATYVYDALGQRIKQSGGTPGTVLYMYDEAGHLLGEYSSTGVLVQETVWLGDIPVATLRPNGASVSIYYVHADHLNTPIRVTRPSDNKLMWTWYKNPFGTDAPNENPASGGTFKYNLRFAGQLYDSHAGLHQNWSRDYDPAIGRYVESDPLGLFDNVNTYSYVRSRPVSWVDPTGLATCGSGKNEKYVPDNPLGFALSPCCTGHDKCYDDCVTSKGKCDFGFLQCVIKKCSNSPGANRAVCTILAETYAGSVTALGGDAFDKARNKCDGCKGGTSGSNSNN